MLTQDIDLTKVKRIHYLAIKSTKLIDIKRLDPHNPHP